MILTPTKRPRPGRDVERPDGPADRPVGAVVELDEEPAVEERLRQPREARRRQPEAGGQRAARDRAVDEHRARERLLAVGQHRRDPSSIGSIMARIALLSAADCSINRALVASITSVLELIHALHATRRSTPRARRSSTARAAARAAPAPRRHQRRRRPRCAARTRRSCTGARSSSTRPTETLRRLAVAARPQRVSGGLDEHARAHARRRHRPDGWLGTPGLEGHRDGAGVQRPLRGRRRPGERPPGALRARRRGGRPRARSSSCASAPSGLFHQRITLRNTGDTPLHRPVAAASRSPCRGTRPRSSTRPAATCASARRSGAPSPSARTCARAAAAGPARTRPSLLAAGRPGFGFERGRVHGIHVAWSGNHRVARRARPSTGEAFLAGGELFAPGRGRSSRRARRSRRRGSSARGATG